MPLLPSTLPPQPFARARVERVIASVRVGIAASTLFAVWLDPSAPERAISLTYTLHASYLAYAVVLLAIMWRRDSRGPVPVATLVSDVIIASVLQYLTLGPSSPFFTYFVYALFSAALRWGWYATVRTAVSVIVMYIAMALYISRTLGPTEFELNRFIIRLTYLLVVTVVLVYLGQHEARLRDEIRQLAGWPRPRGTDLGQTVPNILEYAGRIVGAGRVTCVWSVDQEPWSMVGSWPAGAQAVTRHAPGDIEPVVPASLARSAFVCVGDFRPESDLVVNRDGTLVNWIGPAVHPALMPYLEGHGLASSSFQSDQVSGRVFFADVPAMASDIIPLIEVLAREVGASLDHLYSYERSRQLAVAEDRIRVARNLHDGVLQSLTGIRLQLQSMAGLERQAASPLPVGDRLLAIERALALEQRELRSFIDDMQPRSPILLADSALVVRLDELRRRLALEWQTPITIRVSPEDLVVPDACDHAVPMMVHEAVVNALKHGQPTRVSVDVHMSGDALRITISDDGRGFPFAGRFDQAALVAANAGPVSLRQRAMSLGGEIAVESSPAGARVELSIPVGGTDV